MTPPESGVARRGAESTMTSAAFLRPVATKVEITTLTKRSDFLRAAKAKRLACPGFLLQARKRSMTEPAEGIRVGFTCSKKLGNAVTRNRAKRRLRAIARATLPRHGRSGWDYVLVGRPHATVTRDFAALQRELVAALTKLHGTYT